MPRLDAWKVALVLMLAAPAVEAQLWLGPAALEVRVEDHKGLPVAGAQLQLRYTAIDPKDGPAPVLTDSRGRAAVGSLAEGTWQLEVSREGFMTYMADVAVREKGRPEVLQATQLRVPGALRTLEVQVYRSRSNQAAARPAAPRQEPPRQEAPPQEVARQETPPQPAPRTPAPPVPAPPAPTREEPAAPAPPPQKTTPAAPSVTPPAPVTPPSPAPDTVRVRTTRDRTCPECSPGESSVSIERLVPPGGGSGCGADLPDRLKGGEVPADLPAGCHVLRVALPAGARYTAYRFELQDGGQSLDCRAGQDCSQGTGRWPVNPVLVRNPAGTIVLAPFEAGAVERQRRAVLTVYYTGK